MTQQTTPRKSGEMVARECARSISDDSKQPGRYGGPRGISYDDALYSIRRAISDAVKGSGTVEQMEKITAWLDKLAKGSDEQAAANRGRFESLVIACTADAKNYRATKEKIMPSLTALKALTLPDQPNK